MPTRRPEGIVSTSARELLRSVLAAAVVSLLIGAGAARAQPIQDNSFLIEEAYNQEAGVVQHLSLLQVERSGDWSLDFIEEWPVPDERNQLSAVIPLVRTAEGIGLGDVQVDWRHLLWRSAGGGALFTPRLSVIAPTGDVRRGHGYGGFGLQTNLALSLELSPLFVAHSNLGGTLIPAARVEGGSGTAFELNAGQSVIWLVAPRFNVMLEALVVRSQVGDSPASFEGIVSPGVRYALDFDFAGGSQLVLGLAAPVTADAEGASLGALVYVSFEHDVSGVRNQDSR